jgi:hypothetical protein
MKHSRKLWVVAVILACAVLACSLIVRAGRASSAPLPFTSDARSEQMKSIYAGILPTNTFRLREEGICFFTDSGLVNANSRRNLNHIQQQQCGGSYAVCEPYFCNGCLSFFCYNDAGTNPDWCDGYYIYLWTPCGCYTDQMCRKEGC